MMRARPNTTGTIKVGVRLIVLLGLLLSAAGPALAGEYERARRIHDRLVGIPPDDLILEQMAVRIRNSDPEGAAAIAMRNPVFYNSALKVFITPWTNEERTVHAPLNDYTATVIGIIRDRRNFMEVLTGDIIYVGANQNPGYSFNDNLHYEALEDNGANLADTSVLVRRSQSGLATNWLNPEEAAGVITTRAAGKAFFRAGTNRRMFRYLSLNYLCSDLENLQDNTAGVDRIRQDVTRSPGSESEIFLNTCSGCHTGMDAFAGAFAYFEWVPVDDDESRGRVTYDRGIVSDKHLINGNAFPFGFVTTDDSWKNYWRGGPNSVLGWRSTETEGFGPKTLGRQIAETEAFSRCQVEKVFENVCFRPPSDEDDRLRVEQIRGDFESNGYDLQDVFEDVAAWCTKDL